MLTIQNLSYSHPNKNTLFTNLSMTVNHSDKIALIGNNGVGKSTLLKLIAKELEPDDGQISSETKPYYIPQVFGQFNDLTIAQALQVETKLNALHEILNGSVDEKNYSLLNELKSEVIKLMKEYKNIFVMCSSTDMERLATFHAANKEMKARPFVCDDFQKNVLEIFSDSAGKKSALFDFGEPYAFWKENDKLIQWMQDKGFCMLVRATDKFNDYIEFLLPLLEKDKTILIYSMWKEYANPKSKHANKKYLDFIDKFPKLIKIHTSGHASADCLVNVCNLVNPKKGIIPIHSENSADYKKLPIKEELKDKIITETKTIDDMIIEIKRTTNRQHRV
jgi:ABC-type oligopeptide transport system ATPase subunit